MAIQSRAAETRQKLIEAAVELFVDNGYLETSPQDIADAAGVTHGAFYYHFKSKEDVLVFIAEQGWPVIANLLGTYLGAPEPGLENITLAVFAVADIVSSDKLHWIGFYLDHAIAHISPQARQTHRERVEAFTFGIPVALKDSDLRAGVTRKEAGELLWIALTGAQLMSGALEEKGSAMFDRLAASWNSALRSIVPDEELPRFEQFVNDTAARYGQLRDAEPESRQRAN